MQARDISQLARELQRLDTKINPEHRAELQRIIDNLVEHAEDLQQEEYYDALAANGIQRPF